jgi:hypothetical protein
MTIGYTVPGSTTAPLWTSANVNFITALESAVIDTLTFVGLAPFFKPEEVYTSVPTFRLSETSMDISNGATANWTETLLILAGNPMGIPVPLGFSPMDAPEFKGLKSYGMTRDTISITGPYYSSQPLFTADFLTASLALDFTSDWDLSTGLGSLIVANPKVDTVPAVNMITEGSLILCGSAYPTARRRVPEMLLNPITALCNVYVKLFSNPTIDGVLTLPAFRAERSSMPLETLAIVLDVQKVASYKPEFARSGSGRSERNVTPTKEGSNGSSSRKRPRRKSKSKSKPRYDKKPTTDYSNKEFPASEEAASVEDKDVSKGKDKKED